MTQSPAPIATLPDRLAAGGVRIEIADLDRHVVADLLLDASMAIEAEARMRRKGARATSALKDRADRLLDLSRSLRS